jgi:CRISPR-associated endonuclease Cas1
MKKLLNTLYVTSDGAYLSLDGENVVVTVEQEELGRVPLHTIEGIITFGYTGASPALMGKCADMNKPIVFLRASGRFLARTTGKSNGNIFLRRAQYRLCDNADASLHIAGNIISAKLNNSAAVIRRAVSDHELRLDTGTLGSVTEMLKSNSIKAFHSADAGALRGLEGESANRYFSVFGQLILQQKEDFTFSSRNRRPPQDNVNALLSLSYTLLTSMCASALEAVGLDSYAGFFHTERPGRCSLALDLVEELRAPFADRFVLTLINRKMVSGKSFVTKEDGAVLLTDDARRDFLTLWQKKKQEEITHPYLDTKIEWGLVPHIQAMLLAKYIRGDIDDYPPFVWK